MNQQKIQRTQEVNVLPGPLFSKGTKYFKNVVSENSGNQCINYRMMKNFGKTNIWRLAKNLQLAEF